MTKFIFLTAVSIALALGIFAGGTACAGEPDIRVGILINSKHHKDPSSDREPWNESNPGIYMLYNGWLGGGFKNSHGNSALLLGHEFSLKRWDYAEISNTWAVANGYHDSHHFADQWRVFISINFRLGPVKTWHSTIVSAIGLEHQVAGYD